MNHQKPQPSKDWTTLPYKDYAEAVSNQLKDAHGVELRYLNQTQVTYVSTGQKLGISPQELSEQLAKDVHRTQGLLAKYLNAAPKQQPVPKPQPRPVKTK